MKWSIDVIVNDILTTINIFEDVSFSFVRREGNSSAHLLAFWAAFWQKSGLIPLSCHPAIVAQALEGDGSGAQSWLVLAFFAIK